MAIVRYFVHSVILCCLVAGPAIGEQAIYDVRDFGAEGDGKTLNTHSIQATIDKCAAGGGGTVYLPPGKWLSGTIYLDSHVTLLLDAGSTLLGSRDPNHYAHPRPSKGEGQQTRDFSYWSLIAGSDLKRVTIRGGGTIDGQGSAFGWKGGRRPKGIYLENCRDVLVEGVRMRSAGSWMQHYRNCDRVAIRGIAVFNHVAYNNDGLNIDSCRDVCIDGCMVDSDDDAVVLKSLSLSPCENVTIANCIISSHCNAIKMGTESGGGFQNITISNCTICSPRYSQVTYGRQRGLAGLALEIVDGGTLERIAISNIVIKGVSVPIFMRLGNRARQYDSSKPKPGVGTFRNVALDNIIATDTSSIGCSITGLPGYPVEDISLTNIRLGFEGGGTREDAWREVPEKAASYPESTMFGVLPAYGFYCRHVKGLKLTNVQLQTAAPDQRHALLCEDAEDVTIDALDAGWSPGAASTIRLVDVRDVQVRGCRPKVGTDLFLYLAGSRTERVVLMGNDLSRVGRIAELAADVPSKALVQFGNYLADR
ncbi:MAG: glycoside hydrolase family 28 protein [Phycisphaerales bacterium]|nr:MAG: glycoside hydrolase family 28 protein [Phycisphaerales bacterium]